MKKLRITVDGVAYEVEVELLEDEEETGYGAVPGARLRPPTRSTNSDAPRATPRPAATPPAASPPPTDGGTPGKKELTSPIAGILVEIKVQPGDNVKENDPVVVIEAMKMNTNVHSPVAGVVKEILVKAGEAVQQGHVLMTFE